MASTDEFLDFLQNFISSEKFRDILSQLTTCISEQIPRNQLIQNVSEISIPPHLINPLSGKLYCNPVVESSGKTWEKDELLKVNPEAVYFSNTELSNQVDSFLNSLEDVEMIKDKLYRGTEISSSERIIQFFDPNHKNFGLLNKLKKAKSFTWNDIKDYLPSIFSRTNNVKVANYIIKNMEASFFTNFKQVYPAFKFCNCERYSQILEIFEERSSKILDADEPIMAENSFEEFKSYVDENLEFAEYFRADGRRVIDHDFYFDAVYSQDVEKIKYLQKVKYPFQEFEDGRIFTRADGPNENTIFQYIIEHSSIEFIEFMFSDEVVYDKKFNTEGRSIFESIFIRSFEETLRIILIPAFKPFKKQIMNAIFSSISTGKITYDISKIYIAIVTSF